MVAGLYDVPEPETQSPYQCGHDEGGPATQGERRLHVLRRRGQERQTEVGEVQASVKKAHPRSRDCAENSRRAVRCIGLSAPSDVEKFFYTLSTPRGNRDDLLLAGARSRVLVLLVGFGGKLSLNPERRTELSRQPSCPTVYFDPTALGIFCAEDTYPCHIRYRSFRRIRNMYVTGLAKLRLKTGIPCWSPEYLSSLWVLAGSSL